MKPRFLTRSLGQAFLTPFFLLLLASHPHAEDSAKANVPSDWSTAKKAFDRLVREPSSLTAREFYASISGGKEINCDKTEMLDHIFGRYLHLLSVGRYGIIAIEMLNGNIYAARSAIVLLDFVDNGWQKPHSLMSLAGMRVGASLGELIRVNPALFLRACYEEREDPYLKEKGFPVGFIPFIMHMKKTMVSYEMEMRRKALRSVEDPELRLVRDKCIESIDRQVEEFERNESDRPRFEEHEKRSLKDPEEKVKNVFLEMKSRPSPENMKKVLALFSDDPKQYLRYVLEAMFPTAGWPPREPSEADPFEIILHEARCGNEYAIEVLFPALFYADDWASTRIYSLISNLILMKPALFIEILAKYRHRMESMKSINLPEGPVSVDYLDLSCNYIDFHDYPDALAENVILRRRAGTLAALDIPEHKELINLCIRLIENKLK